MILKTKENKQTKKWRRRNMKATFNIGFVLRWAQWRRCSRVAQRPPAPGARPSTSASSPYLWASGLYIHLFCTSVRKMYPKLSEKPESSDLGTLGMLKKLMIIASLLYSVSTYKKFHRNVLFVDGRGSLY